MRILRWFLNVVLITFIIAIIANSLFHPDFPIYYRAYLTEIYLLPFTIILIIIFLSLYERHRERLKAERERIESEKKRVEELLSEFKKSFPVYKIISELDPSDFGIYSYYETYIHRESDTEAEKSLKEKGIAFITGKPGIGKTRGAYELAKKLEGFYLLKPPYEKIDIQNLKFPPLFSEKKIVLFLDDLEKYVGKFNLDELINILKKNSKEFKIIATCRSGKESDQIFAQKEMATLFSQCQVNKVDPRKLIEKEEKELARGIGKEWKDVKSDGTPGSIVLGLDQMEKRYKDLEDEPKTILHILKLLREARIYTWTEELVKNIAKSKIFELKVERYQWDNWLKVLQDNGFIRKSDSFIYISHDSYLDNKFITDYSISDSILIELKEELFVLKDAENLFYLGNNFYDRKNLKEAIDCYNKSIRINPDVVEVHVNLGFLLAELKNYPEAEKEYRTAIKIDPDYAGAHNNLGILLDDLRNCPEAEEEYRAAIKIDPDYADAHYNLGILLADLKNYPEAEKEYQTAIKLNPDDAEAHNNLGILLEDLKNYPEAEKEYRTAIKINPDYADAHNNLGILLNALKNYSEAEKEYRTAIKINPDYVDAHNNLGILLYDLKNYPEAEQEYQTAIKINPDLANAHYNLGILLDDLKNYLEAEKEYRTTIKIDPDYAVAHYNLGLLYIEMGKKEEAKKELLNAKELFKKQGKEEDVKEVEDILKGLE
jgi:tetratricopeptide (TPR) repeat protein